jgi:SUMO ligase MMS21 Smc5/6 complex component
MSLYFTTLSPETFLKSMMNCNTGFKINPCPPPILSSYLSQEFQQKSIKNSLQCLGRSQHVAACEQKTGLDAGLW